jgi:hypothetical protein
MSDKAAISTSETKDHKIKALSLSMNKSLKSTVIGSAPFSKPGYKGK